jgi:hypothetical protein
MVNVELYYDRYRMAQIDRRLAACIGDEPFDAVLRGVGDFRDVAFDVVERLVEELEKMEETVDMTEADEWRAKYGLWLAVQICRKRGRFTQLEVFNQMMDDGLLEPGTPRFQPWEIAYLRRGPFTHAYGTSNDLTFHRDGMNKTDEWYVAAYPHPGAPP